VGSDGWQQATMSASRSSSVGAAGAGSASASLRTPTASRRARSTALRQAVVTSQPAGFSGSPCAQWVNASAAAS